MFKKIWQIIFNNFYYKVASVLIALIIWGLVQAREIVEVNQRIKVNISVANGYGIKGKPYRFLDATIKGPRVLVNDLLSRPLEGKIYIEKGQVGQLEVPFDIESIRGWDSRVSLIVRNPYISVFVDELVERHLPVREVLQGAPEDGFFIEKVEIHPPKVKVTGLKSELNKMNEVTTELIVIDGINKTKTVEVFIATQDWDVQKIEPDLVKVTLQIGTKRINKTFTGIPIKAIGLKNIYTLEPNAVSVVLQGRPAVIDAIKNEDISAFVDATDLQPGIYTKEIQVKIPPNTVLVETTPGEAQIQIFNKVKRGL